MPALILVSFGKILRYRHRGRTALGFCSDGHQAAADQFAAQHATPAFDLMSTTAEETNPSCQQGPPTHLHQVKGIDCRPNNPR